MKITLIISTYNRPEALRLSLLSARQQTRIPDEVIVADDGSSNSTRHLIDSFAKDFPCPLKHAWQEDKGFRLAESRNNALRMAQGDYIIFIDGDIIIERHFIADHERLAKKGYFVIGSRSSLTEKLTQKLIENESIKVHCYSSGVRRKENALHLPILTLWTKKLYHKRRLYGRGANMAMWLEDLRKINGFDQNLVGYGYEDFDLFNRLFNSGIKRKYAKFQAIEYHLFHKRDKISESNEKLFYQDLKRDRCENGIVNELAAKTSKNE